MFSAWDTISRNRRDGPRFRARVPASISFIEGETDESRWPSVLAYTRDVSREGMALILPSSRLGCHELSEGGHLLRIVLAVSPETNVHVTARLIHCGVFSEDESGTGYLVGVKIKEISAEGRTLYDEFISTLH